MRVMCVCVFFSSLLFQMTYLWGSCSGDVTSLGQLIELAYFNLDLKR